MSQTSLEPGTGIGAAGHTGALQSTHNLNDPHDPNGLNDVNGRQPLVEIKHVDKYFGDLHVLQDINLTVNKGEVLVVIGPSGSGKSTLCRAINRLEPIDSGEIAIEGKPLPTEGKQLAQMRADVGMVFQSFNLFANRSVLDNVTLGPIRVRHIPQSEAREQAMALLKRVVIWR